MHRAPLRSSLRPGKSVLAPDRGPPHPPPPYGTPKGPKLRKSHDFLVKKIGDKVITARVILVQMRLFLILGPIFRVWINTILLPTNLQLSGSFFKFSGYGSSECPSWLFWAGTSSNPHISLECCLFRTTPLASANVPVCDCMASFLTHSPKITFLCFR